MEAGNNSISRSEGEIPLAETSVPVIAAVPPADAVNQRYLFPFVPLGEVQNHVRTQAIASEASRIDELTAAWHRLQSAVQEMQVTEAGLAASISVSDIPLEARDALASVEANPAFAKTFQSHQYVFAWVEIDKMIATQRHVNLDFVAKLRESYEGTLDLHRLIDICLSPDRDASGVKHLELSAAPAMHAFTSPNTNLRYLGSYLKPLQPEDFELAERGGIPVIAVISFVGYGGRAINAFYDVPRKRVILHNGYHRVYALRSLGVTHIPLVLMMAYNPSLHLPAVFPGGMPVAYVLNTPRPSLFMDFFQDGLTVDLLVKKRLKTVTVQVGNAEHDLPV